MAFQPIFDGPTLRQIHEKYVQPVIDNNPELAFLVKYFEAGGEPFFDDEDDD